MEKRDCCLSRCLPILNQLQFEMLQLQLLLLIQLLQLLHGLLLQAAIQKSSRWRVMLITATCVSRRAQLSLSKCSMLLTPAICWQIPKPVPVQIPCVRNLRVLLGSRLPLSLQPSESTVKPAFPQSSHAAGKAPEEIKETPKILCTSFFSQFKSQTYFTHAECLLLHIDCLLVCECKSACMPRDKDLSVGYFQGSTIKEYLSLCKRTWYNVRRYGT